MITIVLTIVQIVVSIIIIGLILLQAKGVGLGNTAMFGGGGEFYSSKRGIEKGVFVATIVLIAVFAAISFSLLLIK